MSIIEDYPDIKIHQAVTQAFEDHTGLNTNDVHRYRQYPYPQRISRLCTSLSEHVLRQKGDIKLYLRLQRELYACDSHYTGALDRSLYKIIQWLDGEMDDLKPVTPEPNTIVISLLVFGDQYVRKFLGYSLKSMMSFENIPCLATEKRVIFYIQTTRRACKQIDASPLVRELESLGVKFEYVLIPDEIIELVDNRDITYWMLGAAATLGFQYAKIHHAAFHHSYPDIVYSERFFSELLRLSKQHNSILGTGMRSDERLLVPFLDEYEKDNALIIPSDDLMALHMNCLHQIAWGHVVNNRPLYWLFPQSHVMLWESEEHIHFNSPHLMAYWLNYETIKDLPSRFYHTMDSEMDFICKGEDFYVITEKDQAYQAELSSPGRENMADIYVDAITAAINMWSCIDYKDSAKFFFREMRVKINRDIRPLPQNHIPAKQVRSMQTMLYQLILAYDKYAGIALKTPRTHLGYIFE